MNRFFSMFLAIAAVLMLATSASAAYDYFWDGGVLSEGYDDDTGDYYDIFTPTGNSNWQDALNWIGDYLPNASYKAVITSGFITYGNYGGEFPPPTTAVHLSSGSATCNLLAIGGIWGAYSNNVYAVYYGGSGSLTVDGGTLTTTDAGASIGLMALSGQTNSLTINSGSISSTSGTLNIYHNSLTNTGTCAIDVNGGALSLGGNIYLSGASSAIFTQTDGSVSTGSHMLLAANTAQTTDCLYDISGGTLSVALTLFLSQTGAGSDANYGTFRVNGSDATIDVGSLRILGVRGKLSYVMDASGVSAINTSSTGIVELGTTNPGALALDFSALTTTIGDITLINNQSGSAISGAFGSFSVLGATYDSGAGTFTLPDNSYYTLNYAGGDGNDLVLEAHAIPEPATAGLLAAGLLGLLAYAWQKRR